jgi:predicted ATPase
MSAALARHDRLLGEAVRRAGGHVFKTVGDAFYAAFGTPLGALEAAVEAQRGLWAEDWSAFDGRLGRLGVRMALHTGLVEQRDRDYFGPPLNRVARMVAIGHGGQILVSSATQGLIRDRLPAGLALLDLGEHTLRDLAWPEHVFQVVADGLPATFPPLRAERRQPHNLAAPLTSFIGRRRELAALADLLASHRLVTLTGPGGIGKTRLALELAAGLLGRFPDGVWLVELDPLEQPGLVPPTVAAVLGIDEVPGHALVDTLAERLKDRRLLLVLDNSERLAVPTAALIRRLLQVATELRVVVTSQEALRISGEVVWSLEPLALPEEPGTGLTAAAVVASPAGALFAGRAAAADPGFRLTDANAAAVARIVSQLDGIPLAIELAAARIPVLAVDEIAARLKDRFRLLTRSRRDAPPRQQTLRGVVDWSYDLLGEAERSLFQRLAVFRGSFTLAAVEAVCLDVEDGDAPTLAPAITGGATRLSVYDLIDGLGELVDKSLLLVASREAPERRYRLLNTLQAYGIERLTASGESAGCRRRHAAFYLKLAEQAEDQLGGPTQAEALARLARDHDNLRAALDRSLATSEVLTGLRLAGALGRFWVMRGHPSEGRHYLDGLLALPGEVVPASVRAKALDAAGTLARQTGDYEIARTMFRQAYGLREELADRVGMAAALRNLGNVADEQGDYDAARRLLEESRALYEAASDAWGVAAVENNLGISAMHQGDNDRARPLLESSAGRFRALGETWAVGVTEFNLGQVAQEQGRDAEAQAHYEVSLEIARQLEDRSGLFSAMTGLARLAQRRGDGAAARRLWTESFTYLEQLDDKQDVAEWLEEMALLDWQEQHFRRAVRLFAAADALRRSIGAPAMAGAAEDYRRAEDDLRRRLGAEYGPTWAAGQALDWAAAAAEALAETDPTATG